MSRRINSNSQMNRDLEESLAVLQQQDDTLAEDDNAQEEDEPVDAAAHEDPLLLAIDDLEGRVISAIDDIKLHPGVRSSSEPGAPTVHQELATLLRPVLEVAAHTGPSIARTYYRGVEGVDSSVDDVYERTISELILPVMLEMAQASTIPATRAAALEFFRHLWQEAHKAGSWLDCTVTGPAAGPYGSGSSSVAPLSRHIQKRRDDRRLAREGEILRYWIQASIACTTKGVFTSEDSESATASRGIIAASASLRPSLRHISQRIKDADDRGANRLYKPVMEMVENVLSKIFLDTNTVNEALLSSCVKFLEIVILCCSRKAEDPSAKRRAGLSTEDFSLDDLPEGHPIIKPEALEAISDYAFTIMKGLTLLGGQRKMDTEMLSMAASVGDGTPSAKVVSILKPAALTYLEIESNFENNKLDIDLDTSNLEFHFLLSQKSYALTLNAMSSLALHRPTFFREAAVCMARRAVYLPIPSEYLNETATKVLASQLRASCLTLLRNAMSVAVDVTMVLGDALKRADMEAQAEKALFMAKQAHKLKSAGRAERNKALLSYEWETSEKTSKRQRETDDYIAQMRAAKAARGLGQGIQLPTSMSDAVELILANLENIPLKRPVTTSKPRKVPVTLEFVVDAIMTNGASLKIEQGKWFDRDGGDAWYVDPSTGSFKLSNDMKATIHLIEDESIAKESENRLNLFHQQSQAAAAAAFGRITATKTMYQSKHLSTYSEQVAARLAFTLKNVRQEKGTEMEPLELSKRAISTVADLLDADTKHQLEKLIQEYPMVAASISLGVSGLTIVDEEADDTPVFIERLLDEALLECVDDDMWKYDRTLELFLAATIEVGKEANDRPADTDRSRSAKQASALLQKILAGVPRLTPTSLHFLAAICDVEGITKKAAESHRRNSQSLAPEAIAASAATHAAKVAAEKRATTALLIIRDIAFVRDVSSIRKAAVECAAGIASGRLPSGLSIQDKALKLLMNVLYPKNETLARFVVEAATEELNVAAMIAVEKYDDVIKANEENKDPITNPLAPRSDEERTLLERIKKPAILYMALCVRRPEMIKELFRVASTERVDTLSKAVKSNMSKLAHACASLDGSAKIAVDVAGMTTNDEIPMLLSFLENLSITPDDDLVAACFEIQDLKKDDGGAKDPRFIIPVVSSMKRIDLIAHLPDFLRANDSILMAALSRMSERLGRLALLYRDEPDTEVSSLHGLTLCEQLVHLHKLDFSALDITQKRYLGAIKLCLDDDEVYNDRVLLSALDHMSGTFLTGAEKLPLGFMRTCILVCTKHESLHPWVAHTLLPRLIDGKIYEDARQWEGWMRCAHMLEKSGESGVNVGEAISTLPAEQAMQYQTKWAGK